MENDGVFAKQNDDDRSLETARDRVFLQVKRLFEYNFFSEKVILKNPRFAQDLICALGSYDWATYARYTLNLQVCVL